MVNWLWRLILLLGCCGVALTGVPAAPPTTASPARRMSGAEETLNTIARDTWAHLSNARITVNHLPSSWWSPDIPGGDYANPAEIGLYALSWLAAYDLGRPWSPSWRQTEAGVSAILDRLRARQTGSQSSQPHGPNAYRNSVFYQWYWISWNPPVVGANIGNNHLVPSVDNVLAGCRSHHHPGVRSGAWPHAPG